MPVLLILGLFEITAPVPSTKLKPALFTKVPPALILPVLPKSILLLRLTNNSPLATEVLILGFPPFTVTDSPKLF